MLTRKFSAKNKRLFFICTLILASVAYIFSYRLAAYSVSLLLIAWFFQKKSFKYNIYYSGIISFFLILLIGLTYSSNIAMGWKIIERFLGFIIFPVVFMTIQPLSSGERKKIISVFVYVTTFFHLFNFLYAVFRQIRLTLSTGASINWYYFYRFDYLSFFDQHPAYTAMFTIMALAYLLFDYKNLEISILKRNILVAINVISLIMVGSRQGYLLLFVLFFYYMIVKLKRSKNKIRTILTFLAAFTLITVISMQIPIIKEQVYVTIGKKQYYRFYYKKVYSAENNPEKLGRLTIWKNAFQVIKQNPLAGQGTGADNQALFNQYLLNKNDFLFRKKYNAHNSYIQWLLSGGIILLLAYLLMLGLLLYYAVKYKDHHAFILFIILFFVSFTETFYRVQGIIFIAFFYSFILANFHANRNKSLKT